jgi:hypothetical protein
MYAIGKFLIDAIVVMFFVGMAGSAVVVAISFVDDFKELFGPDDPTPEPVHAPEKAIASAAAFSFGESKPGVCL